MEKQKRLARNAWTGSGEKIIEQLWIDLANNLDPTEFLGYNSLNSQAKILAIVIDGNVSDKIEDDKSAELIFNQSPFYAESGGQVSDTGIISNENFEAKIENVRRISGLMVHKIIVRKGEIYNLSLIHI